MRLLRLVAARIVLGCLLFVVACIVAVASIAWFTLLLLALCLLCACALITRD